MPGIRFAVTVTLNPKIYRFDATHQFDVTFHKLDQLLDATKIKVCIAELTKNANIHYHLIYEDVISEMKLNKLLKDKVRDKKCDYGFCHVKQIDDEPGWIAYLLKNIRETTELINRPCIIYDTIGCTKDFDYPYKGYFEGW